MSLSKEALPPRRPQSVLEEAAEIVHGARNADYGHPLDNHGRTARLWSEVLGAEVDAEDVCIMNALQKLSRAVTGRMTRDTLVDVCGYMANIEMIWNRIEAKGDGAPVS